MSGKFFSCCGSVIRTDALSRLRLRLLGEPAASIRVRSLAEAAANHERAVAFHVPGETPPRLPAVVVVAAVGADEALEARGLGDRPRASS